MSFYFTEFVTNTNLICLKRKYGNVEETLLINIPVPKNNDVCQQFKASTVKFAPQQATKIQTG